MGEFLKRAAKGAWRRWREARAQARSRAELRRLSDRMLRDIGLRRSQIDALFR